MSALGCFRQPTGAVGLHSLARRCQPTLLESSSFLRVNCRELIDVGSDRDNGSDGKPGGPRVDVGVPANPEALQVLGKCLSIRL